MNGWMRRFEDETEISSERAVRRHLRRSRNKSKSFSCRDFYRDTDVAAAADADADSARKNTDAKETKASND